MLFEVRLVFFSAIICAEAMRRPAAPTASLEI